MRKLITVLLLGSVTGFPSQRASQDDPAPPTATFRIGAKLVEVDVAVRDKRGPAAGLTREDFTLFDNGTPQNIALFSVRSVRGLATARPPSRELPLPPAPGSNGVVSNRPARTEDAPATQTILLLDKIFTEQNNLPFDIARVQLFLNHRRAQDGVGIYSLGTRLRVLQDVTVNEALLRRAANALKSAESSFIDPDTTGMTEHAAAEYQSLTLRERVTALKNGFEAIARHLANVPGRKSLVWITGGFPIRVPLDDFTPDMREAARALNDANVALYAVDARGLIGALGQMTGIAPAEAGPQSAQQITMAMRNRAYAPAGPSHIETMNLLAGLTGGEVYFNTNGLEASFEKAVEAGDVTYALGFYPSEAAQDGKVHKLSVKVARGGLSLRYRENYFATKPLSEAGNVPNLEQLLKDPLDATQIGLLAQAMPDPARAGLFHVRVAVDLHGVQFGNQDGKWVGAVELSFHFENSRSAQVITRKIEIPEAQFAAALEKGIVIDHSIERQGQTGDLRVVVEDKTSGAAGSLRIPLAKQP